MSRVEAGLAAAPDEEVKPYSIRVSSRYLDLTRQKLELTRLPRDVPGAKSLDWWEPKPVVEPLIDFWLEHYSWRDEETKINASVPQFRTSIAAPTPIRIHFIHAPSPHAGAIPLLLIPPFPFTNISLAHLIENLTNPLNAQLDQPFHLVIPSLPGLGFSDALPNNQDMVSTTADMFDTLMKRLTYQYYLTTNSGPAAHSPSEVDSRISNCLLSRHSDSCLGGHLICPPLSPPKMVESPIQWMKWTAARLFQTQALGYSRDDFTAYRKSKEPKHGRKDILPLTQRGLSNRAPAEPNSMAYALCDSPAGLLLFILSMVRISNPRKDFSPTEVITMTELTWLPGPEATMRFWAHCGSRTETYDTKGRSKPRVGITVFLNDDDNTSPDRNQDQHALPRPSTDTYVCPAWGNTQYNVVSSNRVSGRPGLLAWERPEVIYNGVRSLAKAILAVDKRIRNPDQPEITLLEQVVVHGGVAAPAEMSGSTVQDIAEIPGVSRPSLGSPKMSSFPGFVADNVNKSLTPGAEEHGRVSTPPPKLSPLQTSEVAGGADQDEEDEGSPNTVVAVRVRE